MFHHQIFDAKNTFILLIAVIHILLIGALFVGNKTMKTPRRLFALLELNLIAWSLAMVFYRSADTVFLSIFWARILYATAATIPLVFLYFIYVFPEYRIKNLRIRDHVGIMAIPVSVFIMSLLDGFLIRDVIIPSEGEKIILFATIPYAYYSFYIISYFSWSYLYLFRLLRRATGTIRLQVIFLLTGTLVSTLIAVTTNLILVWFGVFDYNWVGQVVIVIMAVLITHALARYNLLNVKIVSSEIFSGIIVLIFTAEFFFSENTIQFFTNGIILGITTVLTFLLIRSVLKEVQTRQQIEQLAGKLEVANTELARINQAKSDFISMASHQLKTPLSIIKGYVSMTLEGSFGNITKKIKEQLEKVFISNERLISLVEDLLNLSRVEAGRMKYDWTNENISDIVQQVVEEVRIAVEHKGLKLIWKPPPEKLYARVDLNKMRNVIFNMADNAIKYTDKGSITVTVTQRNQSVRVSVADTGRGISASQIQKLFTKFTRVMEGTSNLTTVGFGLGLYVARLIVDEHKGRIWAKSAGLGKGSAFLMEVPLVTDRLEKGGKSDRVDKLTKRV